MAQKRGQAAKETSGAPSAVLEDAVRPPLRVEVILLGSGSSKISWLMKSWPLACHFGLGCLLELGAR